MKTLTLFTRKHHTRLLTLLAVLVLWQIGVMLCEIKEFILPTPLTILSQLFLPRYALQHQWLTHISTTLSDIVFSFCVTAGVGIFATILMTWSTAFCARLLPRSSSCLIHSPKSQVAPLFLPVVRLWNHSECDDRVFWSPFFPIVINTITVKCVDDAVASSRNGNLKEVMGGDENFMES